MGVSNTNNMRINCLLVCIVFFFHLQNLLVFAQQDNGLCATDLSNVLPVPFNNMSLTCRPVWNTFVLRFSQSTDNVMTVIMSAVYTSGWVGMGFSADGKMVGSSAMVGWIGKEGQPAIKQYYLRGVTPSEVIPDKGELQLTNIPPAVVLNGATIYLAFQLKLQQPLKAQPILLAFGTKTPNHHHHRLSAHEDKTTLVFDFSVGYSSASSSSSPSSASSSGGSTSHSFKNLMLLKQNHGVLGITGWAILLPAGAIVARYLRHKDPLWYYLHIAIQFVGFIIGLATVVAGKVLYDRIQANIPSHATIGILVLVLSILQILAFFARPDKDSKIRKYWNWYHHWFGRLALFLAALNILLGIQAGNAGNNWRVSYGLILTIILVTVVVLEVLLRMRKHKQPPIYETNPI